jgi:hypothetical protein
MAGAARQSRLIVVCDIWKRATAAELSAPKRRNVVRGAKLHTGGRPVHWNGDAIKRAAVAIRENYSTDFYVLARRALEGAIRNEADLLALLPEPPATAPLRRSIERTAPQPDHTRAA